MGRCHRCGQRPAAAALADMAVLYLAFVVFAARLGKLAFVLLFCVLGAALARLAAAARSGYLTREGT